MAGGRRGGEPRLGAGPRDLPRSLRDRPSSRLLSWCSPAPSVGYPEASAAGDPARGGAFAASAAGCSPKERRDKPGEASSVCRLRREARAGGRLCSACHFSALHTCWQNGALVYFLLVFL